MKSRKLKLLETLLRWMAAAVLKRHKPIVVGITGSVGKTSAKEAVYLALASKFSVRKNEKNYNNEIGIPLTIIDAESGYRSLRKWLKVLGIWLKSLFFFQDYPRVLVLEMGVDAPGDMSYLVKFVPVKIAVVTSIAPVHLERFKSVEHIAKEKEKIIRALPEDGFAILSADDERVLSMARQTKGRVITFGFSPQAQVRASDALRLLENGQPAGISFKINYDGKSIPVRLRGVFALHQIEAVLAGFCAGIAFKINLVEVVRSLENFSSLPGRMKLVQGKGGSLIIDDSYNASPKAALAALETLGKISARRKITVLGDMLELGQEEKKGHQSAARKIYEIGANLFVGVGDRMKITARELERLGFGPDKIKLFESPQKAGIFLEKTISVGDWILVKGSQGMRMEKVVEKIMAEPEKARFLLCRQDEQWWKKPYIKP